MQGRFRYQTVPRNHKQNKKNKEAANYARNVMHETVFWIEPINQFWTGSF